jgi:membrane protein implicated in regulation of membrane protease activity
MSRYVLTWWGGAAVMAGAMALCCMRGDWPCAAIILAGLMMFLIDYLDRMLAKPKPGARP